MKKDYLEILEKHFGRKPLVRGNGLSFANSDFFMVISEDYPPSNQDLLVFLNFISQVHDVSNYLIKNHNSIHHAGHGYNKLTYFRRSKMCYLTKNNNLVLKFNQHLRTNNFEDLR